MNRVFWGLQILAVAVLTVSAVMLVTKEIEFTGDCVADAPAVDVIRN